MTAATPRTGTVEILYSPTFGGWLVAWAGVIHGGVHFQREDAEQHADALRHAEDWDTALWLETHA